MLYRGRALARTGRNGDAVKVLSAVATTYSDSIVQVRASVEAGRSAIAAGDARTAVSLLASAAALGTLEARTVTGGPWVGGKGRPQGGGPVWGL